LGRIARARRVEASGLPGKALVLKGLQLGAPPSYRAERTKDKEVDQPGQPHRRIGSFGPNRRASKAKLFRWASEMKSTLGFSSDHATDNEMKAECQRLTMRRINMSRWTLRE
jgi:hypothetical protein